MRRWALVSLAVLLLVMALHFIGSDPERREPLQRTQSSAAAPPPPNPAADASAASQPLDLEQVLGFVRTARGMLEEGDYYSAVGFLAFAHEARPDLVEICVVLAETYHQLNWTQEAAELLPCLWSASGTSERALGLIARIERSVDFEPGFELAESDHFVASYPGWDASSEAITSLLDLLERTRRSIEARTGLATTRPIPVVIYERRKFARALGVPTWAAGVFDMKIHVPFEIFEPLDRSLEYVLKHEYVHALLWEHGGSQLPRWLDEGLASYLADFPYEQNDFLELLEPLDELFDLSTLSGSFRGLPAQDVSLAYLQSYWMTHDLVEEDGWKRMRALLNELNGDRSRGFDAAFANTYGESPGEYLERWYEGFLPAE